MHTYIIAGCFILFDIITGIAKAFSQGGINSTYLRQGLFHKLSEVLAIAASALLEYGAQYIHINVDLPITEVVVAYICVMEIISILENICAMNPKLAKFFKPYLEKLKGEDENDTEKRN